VLSTIDSIRQLDCSLKGSKKTPVDEEDSEHQDIPKAGRELDRHKTQERASDEHAKKPTHKGRVSGILG
jgi:hypothetical protein